MIRRVNFWFSALALILCTTLPVTNWCPFGSCSSDKEPSEAIEKLLAAAQADDMNGVKEALKDRTVDINGSTSNKMTALCYATVNNSSALVTYLLQQGANPNTGNPIFIAEKIDIAEMLIKHGAHVNAILELPRALFPFQMDSINTVIVEFLEHEENPYIKIDLSCSNCGITPLHCAVLKHSTHLVKTLLDHGANACLTDNKIDCSECCYCKDQDEEERSPKTRKTPLQYALYEKQQITEILKLFEEHNLQERMLAPTIHCSMRPIPNREVCNFITGASNATRALYLAVGSGDTVGIEKALKMKDVDLHSPCYPSILGVAIELGHEKCDGGKTVIECLLTNGVDPNDTFPSPLCMVQNPEIAQLLIDHGARVNQIVSWDGATILGELLRRRRFAVAKVLIKNGADVNVEVTNGMTPLHLAVLEKRIKLVELLLQHGADGKILALPTSRLQDEHSDSSSGTYQPQATPCYNRLREKMVREMAAKTPYQIAKEAEVALDKIIKIFNDHGIYE